MKSTSRITICLLILSSPMILSGQVSESRMYSDWGPIIHLPPPINSEFDDHAAILTEDELTMYFTSNRRGSIAGSEDIWISKRKGKDSPWRSPVNLGPKINSNGMDRVRSFADGGRILVFQSDREGGYGFSDIWLVYRNDLNDDTDWSEPVNLGSTINTPFIELAANYLIADSGYFQKLYFSSTKPGGFGGPDIYESTINDLGFQDSVNVFELNSPSIETCFWVRNDGLEMIFSSNRPDLNGDIQKHDMWVSHRDSIHDRWAPPERLGPNINVPDWQDVNPALSFDNRTMLIASRRPGGIGPGTFDIYVTTRKKYGGR